MSLIKESKKQYKSIFISDVHLGTRGCKIDYLLDFLETNEAENIYLLGDIFDGWRLKKSWFWPKKHSQAVDIILEKAKNGTKVVYIPGNHDEDFRSFDQQKFANIEIVKEAIHETEDGRKFYLIHGDAYDDVCIKAPWIAFIGDILYTFALRINNQINRWRSYFGYDYWSISAWLKLKIKRAVQFISDFEKKVAQDGVNRNVDGVICGHVHHAEIKKYDNILYINTGDWVESCTALVEHKGGRLELLDCIRDKSLISESSNIIAHESLSKSTSGQLA